MPLFASTQFVRLLSGKKEEPLPRFVAPAIEICDEEKPAGDVEGLLLVDARGRIAAVDAAVEPGLTTLLGYEARDLLGKRYTRLFTPGQVESRAPEIAFFLANKSGRHVGPVFRQRKDGDIIPLRSRLDALRDASGAVAAHLESLQAPPADASVPPDLAVTGEAVFLLDCPKEETPRIVLAGCEAGAVTGWAEADLVGQPWEFLFPGLGGEERAAFSGALLGALPWSGSARLRRKDGSTVAVACRLLPLDDGTRPGGRTVMRLSLAATLGAEEEDHPSASKPEPSASFSGSLGERRAPWVAQPPKPRIVRIGRIGNGGSGSRLDRIESSLLQVASAARRLFHVDVSIHGDASVRERAVLVPGYRGSDSVPGPASPSPSDKNPRRVPFFDEWLPVGKPQSGSAPSPRGSVDYSLLWPSGSETVLLLDDNAPIRRLLSASLRTLGYRIIEVGDQDAAFAIIGHEDPIDVLVADVILPNGSGVEVASRFRACHDQGVVLYISAYVGNPKVSDLFRNEAHLPKPFTPLSLARKIREILAKGRG